MISVTLGKFLHLSGPWLTHVGNRDHSIVSPYLRRHQEDLGSWGLEKGFPRKGLGHTEDGKWMGNLGGEPLTLPRERVAAFASSFWEVTTEPLECSA